MIDEMTYIDLNEESAREEPGTRRRRQLRVEELMVFLGNEQAVRMCQ